MKNVLWGVLGASLAGGYLLRLFPRQSRMMPYVRFLLSLILLGTMLSPLSAALAGLHTEYPFGNLFPVAEADLQSTYYEETVAALAQKRAEQSLCMLIAAETGIAADDMTVSFASETQHRDDEYEITVTGVSVTLYRRAHRIAEEKIRDLVERTMYCPCTVLWEEAEDA